MTLDRLLRPRSIAVVGGGAWCANVIRECRKIGFDGALWPVHPTKPEMGGLPAFASIEDLPGVPDASFVGVNRHTTIEVITALARQGAGGAICFASGFQEAVAELHDGADLQAALLQAAGDMPILGPNCYGLINGLDGITLWPDHHGTVRVDRGVAVVTQSSNIALNLTMQTRGLPLAYLVTAGNQAQTDLAAIGMALLNDPRVTALGLHIEGIGALRRFEALAAEARRLGTPIIALKVGASDQARIAAVSHTASLAGSDAGARALLRRLGIGQVESLSTFLEVLKLLHVTGPLPSNRIASMSCSGGEASLMADMAVGRDVSFPALNERQVEQLREALGPKVALANPLDYHTYIWADRAAMAACFAAMLDDDIALALVVLDFPRPDRCPAPEWNLVIEAVGDAMAAKGRPIAILSSLPETLPEEIAEHLIARGIVPLAGLNDAIDAIAIAAHLERIVEAEPLLVPGPDGPSHILDEAAAKSDLASFGLAIPQGRAVSAASEAVATTRDIGGAVVVKGTGLTHKTEAGAVAVNVSGDAAVCDAVQSMAAASFLIEEMIGDGVVELLVGVVRDEAHGFVLTLGAGGTFAELMDDTTHLLLPTHPAEINTALDGLRLAPRLHGYRGAPAVDRSAIVSAVLAVQDYVVAHAGAVFEVEVNPLICTPTRAVAADALIRLRET